MAIPPSPRDIGMGGYFDGFGVSGLDEFKNLSDDHSYQASTGSRKERNPQSYIVYSHLGNRVEHAQSNVSLSQPDVQRIRLTRHVKIGAGCEK